MLISILYHWNHVDKPDYVSLPLLFCRRVLFPPKEVRTVVVVELEKELVMHDLEVIEGLNIGSFGSSCPKELLTKLLCHDGVVITGGNEVEFDLLKLRVLVGDALTSTILALLWA